MTLGPEAAARETIAATSEFEISLEVNGRTHRLRVEARSLLSDVLRHDLHLTGTHVGCEQGVCGACTVVCDGVLVRSCLMFAVQVDGSAIETIEAVANGNELHPIQSAFHDEHGLQCGFCTPGMVLAARALLAAIPDPSEEEIREYLSGNICRCTGYSGIVTAVQESARRLAGRGSAP